MIKVYPVVLTPDEHGYAVYVPDLEINTQGANLAEAIYMARDAIGLWSISEQDDGRNIPAPSTTAPAHEPDELISWVDIDIDNYRKAHDMATMRINVTVPRYLKVLGDDAGINFSGVLQEALRERFNVNNG